ncbi:MAG: GtrA family protein [Commensalibacter sp.]
MLNKLIDIINPKYKQTLIQFFRFGIVGLTGLAWDTLTVYALRHLIGLTLATILAYFVAATSNWIINRYWTFHGMGNDHHMFYQWLRFIGANGLGFLLNRGTVFALFMISNFCNQHPVFALMAGAVAGMFVNFNLSQKLVFSSRKIKQNKKSTK